EGGSGCTALRACGGEAGPDRDGAVVACDRLLEAAHPLERDTAVAPALKKTRANGERTIIRVDRFRQSVQRHQQIGAIDVGVDEIRLMRDGAVEARQCLVGATELLECSAQQVVSGRVFRRNLDSLTQELDGFLATLEFAV